MAAVKKVLSGGRYVSPAVAEKLAQAAAEGWSGTPHENLSHREMQVLQMIATGKTIKEIAGELALSEKTIATYRSRISEKLGLSTNVELTRYALQHSLVERSGKSRGTLGSCLRAVETPLSACAKNT